jgi:hypothetical protein
VLTFEEVNDLIPADVQDAPRVDAVMDFLGDNDIEVEETVKAKGADEADEDQRGFASRGGGRRHEVLVDGASGYCHLSLAHGRRSSRSMSVICVIHASQETMRSISGAAHCPAAGRAILTAVRSLSTSRSRPSERARSRGMFAGTGDRALAIGISVEKD